MKISCYGCRGSIPVSGPEYLKYGGDTTCLEIRTADDDCVIVDCGSGLRRLGNRLLEEGRRHFHIIFTHAHWDHISGFPFFKPLYRSDTVIEFHGCPFAQRSVRTILEKTMEPPYFPVDLGAAKAELHFHDSCIAPFNIGRLDVDPILLSHPNQGIGYRFTEMRRRFVFLTDNELGHVNHGGLPFDDYLEFSRGADLLVHDAEYTDAEYPRVMGWGHSTWQQAIELALRAGVGELGLFHHNQDRQDSGVEAIEAECRRVISERKSSLSCFAMTQDTVIDI
jgi:phosphoribosyl 1,2-cyclic phosphodiesterase